MLFVGEGFLRDSERNSSIPLSSRGYLCVTKLLYILLLHILFGIVVLLCCVKIIANSCRVDDKSVKQIVIIHQGSLMVTLCGNCEKEIAVSKCLQCENSLAFLCSPCQALHLQIKQFRHHKLEPLSPSEVNGLCRNCESSPVKFVCKQCGEEDRYLCLGCSVLHPKIKAFRSHVLLPLFNNGSNMRMNAFDNWQLDRIANLSWIDVSNVLTQLYRNITERSVHEKEFWTSASLLVGLSVVYYVFCKKVFAGFSTAANIVIGIVIYKYAAGARAEENVAGEQISKSNTLHARDGRKSTELEDKDFANEFDYPLTGKKASFRPRTRAYKPRKSHNVLPENNIVLEDVD